MPTSEPQAETHVPTSEPQAETHVAEAAAAPPTTPTPPAAGPKWPGLTDVTRVSDGLSFAVFSARRGDDAVVVKRPKGGAPKDHGRLLRGLSHPSIPKLLDELDATLVLEKVDGETLVELVSSGRYRRNERETMAVIADAARAIDYLHALRPPIIHRDVSPQSLMLDAEDRVHLIDLSCATDDPRELLTSGPAGLGAPHYVSAEQLTEGATGPEHDVFALGSTAAFLLTGLDPREIPRAGMAPDLRALGVSEAVAALVIRCMDLDAGARPTAAEVAAEAEAHAAGPSRWAEPPAAGPIASRPPSSVPLASQVAQPHGAVDSLVGPTMSSAGQVAATSSESPGMAAAEGDPRLRPASNIAPLAALPTAPALPRAQTLSSFPVPPPADVPLRPTATMPPPADVEPIPLDIPMIDELGDPLEPRVTKQGKLDGLWAQVLAAWDNPAIHETFIDFAVNSGQYPIGASRYGEVEDAGGERAETAGEYRREIGIRAAGRIIATAPKTAAPERMGNLSKVGFALFGVGTIIGLIMGNWFWFAAGTPFLALAIEAWRRGRA